MLLAALPVKARAVALDMIREHTIRDWVRAGVDEAMAALIVSMAVARLEVKLNMAKLDNSQDVFSVCADEEGKVCDD